MTPGVLITPCDPGNCHIYFGVQLRALPTALALSKALKRRLLLPPFEWYENQAQMFANAFRATPQGRVPHFTPWSELFDIERLRAAGVDAVDFINDESSANPTVDRALLQMAGATGGSSGVLSWMPCKRSDVGIRANVTWVEAAAGSEPRATAADLYGHQIPLGDLKCAAFSLQHNVEAAIEALTRFLDGASTGAIFNVGHHIDAKLDDRGASVRLLERSLRPSSELEEEAQRFMAAQQWDSPAASPPHGPSSHAPVSVLAVHWRHGDYVAYSLLTPLESVVSRADRTLQAMGCGGGRGGRGRGGRGPEAAGESLLAREEGARGGALRCAVFLMTNCRNASALQEFASALAPTPVVSYAPPSLRFAHEGRRLVIEQAIASRAVSFLGSSRSAVSEYVETLRRGRGAGGREAELRRKAQQAQQAAAKVEL